jgi:hypothetical protein
VIFGWFRRAKPVEDTRDLQERVIDLEKSFRRLSEEWTEVYHKFRTLQMRTAKQVQRLDKESEDGHAENGAEELPVDPSGSEGPLLTPRQRLIQSQIEERRKRLQKGGQT